MPNTSGDKKIPVAKVDELPAKKPLCVKVEGLSLAIGHAKGEYYAVENMCTHAASTFDDGKLKAHFIVCPLHGVMFDMKTGEPRGTLAKQPLKTYPVSVEGDQIVVTV